MHRRTLLAGTAAAIGTATAGCGFILGEESLSFEAEVARVPESVAEDTGYTFEGVPQQTFERTFEVADQSRTVSVTNRMAEYEKTVDLGPLGELRAAIFTALSTPKVSILGQTFNPVAELSTADLVERIQAQFEDIGSLERDGETTIAMLGTETTLTRFTGRTRLAGDHELDIYLHVSEAVEHEDDFVIAVGGYPQRLPGEESNVMELTEGIDHPA
jgi:hypothetical protein